ncbi:DNA mismatch repair protein Mlh1 [Maublancomyces gigas]|uniref:DNA mismatch repair protein Mlh1 n=1 Tax=Discina gigas TaxID=1032678 RepID=A0ABR3GBI4_9PEZI
MDMGSIAVYSDGKLVPPKPGQNADPKPVAGRQGTQITVEDLFYNVPSRRRAFRSPSEEYSKILDVVGRYAVHCGGVSFSCKKHGDTDMGVSTTASSPITDRIRRVHGSAVANELLEFKVSDKSLGFTAKGMLSNANYHVKKTTLLLFINHRSVESSSIKRGIEATYSAFLPKGGHPFAYLSLEIEPHRVDVNVHPTKREVNFLHEDEIVQKICETIQEKLAAVDTSRSYTLTQTLLPGAKAVATSSGKDDDTTTGSGRMKDGTPAISARTKKPYEYNMVRVDNRDRKITTMLQPNTDSPDGGKTNEDQSKEYGYDNNSQWTLINYTTVRKLRADVRESAHKGLCEMFQNHTFIGVVDEHRRLAAVQHGVKLYLVDYAAVCFEMFYQIGLSDFANFGHIRLNPSIPLREILEIAIEEETSRTSETQNGTGTVFDWEAALQTIEKLLIDKRQMLKEYFAMEITESGELTSIPLLLKGYMPSLGKLPSFILRLGPNVDWNSELECFDTLLREIALFYVPEILPPGPESPPAATQAAAATGDENSNPNDDGGWGDAAVAARRDELKRSVEAVLFPAVKKRLIAPKTLLRGVTEVANLKGLYRIFERSC